MLVTYFYHKTTRVPGTGLTATVTLVNANNDTKVLDNVSLTELTSLSGAYVHPYQIDKDIDYIAYFSCTDTNYLPSIDKLYIPAKGFGVLSGGRSTQYDYNATDRKNIEKILESVEKTIPTKINETNSHIELVKTGITDKIDSIEIPETIVEEKEAKKVQKMIKEVDKKLTKYIESDNKEDVTELANVIRKQHEDKMKMEEEELKRKQMEEEQDAKMLEEIKAEFDKQEQDEMEEKRKELEKELEEKQKEAEEIKKELNSLK